MLAAPGQSTLQQAVTTLSAGSNGFVAAIFTAAPTDAAEVYAGVASPPPYPQQPRKELAEVPRGLFVVFLCSPPTLCA